MTAITTADVAVGSDVAEARLDATVSSSALDEDGAEEEPDELLESTALAAAAVTLAATDVTLETAASLPFFAAPAPATLFASDPAPTSPPTALSRMRFLTM